MRVSCELDAATISEATVDKLTVQYVKDALGAIFEYTDADDGNDHTRIATIAMVAGAIELADNIKQEIKKGAVRD